MAQDLTLTDRVALLSGADIASALASLQQSVDWADFKPSEDNPEESNLEIRLQVYPSGSWFIRTGAPDYDLDHHGVFGAASLSAADTAEVLLETAVDLLNQCRGGAPDVVGCWNPNDD